MADYTQSSHAKQLALLCRHTTLVRQKRLTEPEAEEAAAAAADESPEVAAAAAAAACMGTSLQASSLITSQPATHR